MSILDYREGALHEILDGRVASVEELDLVTGKFGPIFSSASSEANGEVIPIRITPSLVVARATPIRNSPETREFIESALSLLYQRNWTGLMLDSTLKPMKFDVRNDEYYAELAQRALISLQGRYALIRLFDDTEEWKLNCIAIEDQLGLLPHSLADYDVTMSSPCVEVYRRCNDAFHESEEYISILSRSRNADLFETMTQPGTGSIRSIIISPLTIGEEVKGFINIGYDIEIDLNDYLRVAFASVVNHICIASQNFERLHEISNLRNIKVRDFIEHLHVDLVQGFRHSAHNALLTADIARRRMIPHYVYKGEQRDNPANLLESSIGLAEAALESMASLRAYAAGKEVGDVLGIFESAVDLLDLQLKEAGIVVRPIKVGSPNLEAFVNHEALRSAFANLLLNSQQAMVEAKTRKEERRINVTFKRDAGTIFIDYVDSGPGVRIPAGDIKTYEDIWVAGKTSKKSGTGYGLTMVREVIQGLHTGSIDLWSSARGAHFKIALRDGLS